MKHSESKQNGKGAIGRRDVLKVLGAGAAASAAPMSTLRRFIDMSPARKERSVTIDHLTERRKGVRRSIQAGPAVDLRTGRHWPSACDDAGLCDQRHVR